MSEATKRLCDFIRALPASESVKRVLLDDVVEARKDARVVGEKEGFEKAREMAADSARIARPPEGMQLSARDKVVFGVGVRVAVERIRAMRDEAEAPSFCRRPGCGHQWHEGPCTSTACICSAVWPPFVPEGP